MVTTIKIKIEQARNLPVMDTMTGLTDGYVEMKFGDEYYEKTAVKRKTLNPKWEEDFRMEVPDHSYIQDNVIELRVWDYDLVSTNDVIGIVFIDVNLLMSSSQNTLEGWLPIYDSLKGLRGELKVSVKVDTLSDKSKFKDSSHDVEFFSTSLPVSNEVIEVQHMVEELLVDEDPEHDWMDQFRSSRNSNAQRQKIMYELSGRVRRKIGIKVQEGGAYFVCGYHEHFDLDQNGIIVRGIGTQCRALPKPPPQQGAPIVISEYSADEEIDEAVGNNGQMGSPPLQFSPDFASYQSYASKLIGNRLTAEVTLVTMKSLPDNHVLTHVGGIVSARSVKMTSDKKIADVSQERDSWWNELREEVRGHARTLNCTHVLGYTEEMIIKKDLCILMATGTAASLKIYSTKKQQRKSAVDKTDCKMLHLPYSPQQSPFDMKFVPCIVCKKHSVPELLLSTTDLPSGISTCGQARFIEARVCRFFKKRKNTPEGVAKQLSEFLPFVDYDLHRQLLNKMRLYCINACFNLTYSFQISESKIVATVSGTGVYVQALPLPKVLRFDRSLKVVSIEDNYMFTLQKQLQSLSEANTKTITTILKQLQEDDSDGEDQQQEKQGSITPVPNVNAANAANASAQQQNPTMVGFPDAAAQELAEAADSVISEPQPAYVVEIDDDTDEDNMAALIDPLFPEGMLLNNLQCVENVPGYPKLLSNIQEIIVQKRYALNAAQEYANQQLASVYNDMYSSLAYRLQLFTPCALCGIKSDIKLASDTELIITWQAMVVLLKDEKPASNKDDEDKILTVTKPNFVNSVSPPLQPVNPAIPTLIDPQTPHPMTPAMDAFKKSFDVDVFDVKGSPRPAASSSAENQMQFPLDDPYTSSDSDNDENDRDDANDSLPSMSQLKKPSILSLHSESNSYSLKTWMSQYFVIMTPLSFVPGAQTREVVGRVCQHFVREIDDYTQQGYSSFIQNAIMEINTVIRAYVRALECNALLQHQISYHVMIDNPYRKQAYCLLSVSGDAARVDYDSSLGMAAVAHLNDMTIKK